MKLCVCLDKKNGMMFFGKRQSQDSVQRERLLELVGTDKLWMSEYSAKMFNSEKVIVDNNCGFIAGEDDYCFIEDTDFDIKKCSTVILYKWNRQYPADKLFSVDLKANGFKLLRKTDFEGSSHDKITEEIYEIK